MANREWTEPMQWTNEGVAPSETLSASGFKGGDKPPAGVFNYFLNKSQTCVDELQTAVDEESARIDTINSEVRSIAKGGTGANTAVGALSNLGLTATAAELNKMDGVTATTAEINYLDGVTSSIQTQLDGKQAKGSYAAASHTHNYAGSSSAGGSATSAVKLDSSAGSATQPVYFSSGKPAACTYTLEKSVPSDAKFTDTTYSAATTSAAGLMSAADKTKLDGIATGANAYSLPTASSSTLGGVKTTSTVTSNSGYTACPIISGVPYYKDTNTTYSLSSFGVTATATELNKLDGVTATATELNYVDGVTSNIQTQLDAKAPSSHSHSAATTSANGFMSSSDKSKLDGIATGANAYTHPSYTAKSSGLYKVTVDSSGHVSAATAVTKSDITALGIPASDTDTVYTHPGYTARTGVPTANAAPAFGGTFSVSQPVSDATGHITALNSRTITIPSTAASQSAAGLMSAADKTKLDGIATGANNYTYTLPAATSSTLGGVKTGSNITNSSGTISLTKANVTSALGYTPPTTNTTYSAGTGLSLSGTTFSWPLADRIKAGTGTCSVIIGDNSSSSQPNTVSGDYSAAIGYFNHIMGNYSAVIGYGNEAGSHYSFVAGYDNTANMLQTVIGKFATISDGPSSLATQSGDIFKIGNGTSLTRANAMRVTGAGKVYGNGTFGSSGADYAEMWEWADGNPNNEDRRGRFVTVDENNKIAIATPSDEYILGIISATPVIIGDVQSENWRDMYLKDVFGENLVETVEVEETKDENTGEVIPAHTEKRWILNPEYDPTKPYVSRDERQEWAAVGLMGKLIVIDDGTCVSGQYCKVAENGTATASTDKQDWRVLKRLDETHVQILYR